MVGIGEQGHAIFSSAIVTVNGWICATWGVFHFETRELVLPGICKPLHVENCNYRTAAAAAWVARWEMDRTSGASRIQAMT
jgi:hypothetical protein